MVNQFDLLEEPWIPVVTESGGSGEVSLLGALETAPSIRRIGCELPTMDVAVLRLLLAVVLRALDDPDRDAVAARRDWAEAWGDWSGVVARCRDYLGQVGEAFDLFHPTRPFLQVADLEPGGQLNPNLPKLVPELGEWFSTRAGKSAEKLRPAEAVRWMLQCQSFDTAGIKTGAKGDPKVKGGRGYPTGYPAWCGNLGLVVAEGANLAQTILLNLPLDFWLDDDSAVWEREQPSRSRDDQRPQGVADLLVWPNRRFRLFTDAAGDVCNVMISYGDNLSPQNMERFEPKTAWRLSETQTKKLGVRTLMPITHDPTRQVWRGVGAWLAGVDGRPKTLDWLARLRADGTLPGELPVTVRIVGVEYGSKSAVITNVFTDVLDTALVTLSDVKLGAAAQSAVTETAFAVGALTTLAGRLALAIGADENLARERAATQGYAAADQPYRAWFRTLRDPVAELERSEYTSSWHTTLRQTFMAVGRSLCEAAGPRAVTGRVINGALVDRAAAWAAFTSRLHTITTVAESGDHEQEQ